MSRGTVRPVPFREAKSRPHLLCLDTWNLIAVLCLKQNLTPAQALLLFTQSFTSYPKHVEHFGHLVDVDFDLAGGLRSFPNTNSPFCAVHLATPAKNCQPCSAARPRSSAAASPPTSTPAASSAAAAPPVAQAAIERAAFCFVLLFTSSNQMKPTSI